MSLETYEVTLRTIGPVHIGNGESLSKSDYIFNHRRNVVHVVNGRKLVVFLKRLGLFDSFLMTMKKRRSHLDLYQFLKRETDDESTWNEFIEYSIQLHKSKNDKLNAVNPFIRDSMLRPYVPGSSLKGALRTILAGDKRDPGTNKLFGKIKVSDSEPLHDKQFVIYQKIDVNKAEKSLPLYRECIDSNQEITMYLTIEDNVITIKEIKRKIALFYENYYNKWLAGFEHTPGGKTFFEEQAIPDVVTSSADEQVFFIGGGVGFANKTVYYQQYDKETAKRKAFNQLKRSFRHVYGKFNKVPNNVPIALKAARNLDIDTPYLQGACYISFKKI